MNTSEKIKLHWNENAKMLYVGEKKRQDNPKGNKQSENLLQSSQNYCFLLKNFAWHENISYLSAALDFFVRDIAFLLALKGIFTNIPLKSLVTFFVLLSREQELEVTEPNNATGQY